MDYVEYPGANARPEEIYPPCFICAGLGVIDSGGFSPQGHPIDIACPNCDGKGYLEPEPTESDYGEIPF